MHPLPHEDGNVANQPIEFVHRLDAPCSGLLLVGMTHGMGHFLCFQLHDGALKRDYEVHSRGSMWCMHCEVHAPLSHCSADGMATRTGKPAQTHVSFLSHFAEHLSGTTSEDGNAQWKPVRRLF